MFSCMNLKIGQLDDQQNGNTGQAAAAGSDEHKVTRWNKSYAVLTSKLKSKRKKKQVRETSPSSQAAGPSLRTAIQMTENDSKEGVEVFRAYNEVPLPATDTQALEPGRRLSLGNLMGKGIVSGLKGYWEANNSSNNTKPGALGKPSNARFRSKFNPTAQSQDRGLLFKLTDAKLAAHADDTAPAKEDSPEPIASVASPEHVDAHNNKDSTRTPKSAFKKMWESMTNSSIKQHKAEQQQEDPSGHHSPTSIQKQGDEAQFSEESHDDLQHGVDQDNREDTHSEIPEELQTLNIDDVHPIPNSATDNGLPSSGVHTAAAPETAISTPESAVFETIQQQHDNEADNDMEVDDVASCQPTSHAELHADTNNSTIDVAHTMHGDNNARVSDASHWSETAQEECVSPRTAQRGVSDGGISTTSSIPPCIPSADSPEHERLNSFSLEEPHFDELAVPETIPEEKKEEASGQVVGDVEQESTEHIEQNNHTAVEQAAEHTEQAAIEPSSEIEQESADQVFDMDQQEGVEQFAETPETDMHAADYSTEKVSAVSGIVPLPVNEHEAEVAVGEQQANEGADTLEHPAAEKSVAVVDQAASDNAALVDEDDVPECAPACTAIETEAQPAADDGTDTSSSVPAHNTSNEVAAGSASEDAEHASDEVAAVVEQDAEPTDAVSPAVEDMQAEEVNMEQQTHDSHEAEANSVHEQVASEVNNQLSASSDHTVLAIQDVPAASVPTANEAVLPTEDSTTADVSLMAAAAVDTDKPADQPEVSEQVQSVETADEQPVAEQNMDEDEDMGMDMEPPVTPFCVSKSASSTVQEDANVTAEAVAEQSANDTATSPDAVSPAPAPAFGSPAVLSPCAMDMSPIIRPLQLPPAEDNNTEAAWNVQHESPADETADQAEHHAPAAAAPLPSLSPRLSHSSSHSRAPLPSQAVSMGTDALVSDLMSALGDVRASDMKHVWAAAGASNGDGTAAYGIAASPQLSPLNLAHVDVDMEDMTGNIGDHAANVTSPDDGHASVPPLQSFQSPLASPLGNSSSQSQREQMMRESIPLFVRDSYAVTDSVSLARESLASVEPFGRPSLPRPSNLAASRLSGLMASMMTLDTLQEDECFTSDLPVTPTGALPGNKTPRSRALHSTTAHMFKDTLPHHLPDPEILVTPQQQPTAAGMHSKGPSAAKVGQTAVSVATTPDAGPQSAPDTSSIALQKSTGKTATTAGKRIAGPASSPAATTEKTTAAAHGTTAARSPATRVPHGSNTTPSSLSKTAHGHHTGHTTPGLRTRNGPTVTPGQPSSASRHAVASPLSAAGLPAAIPAAMPPVPSSWDTPLAQMQQLPLDFAVHAPLMDNSPFPDLDNMDTFNIAEEASRMAQALGGRGKSATPTFKPLANSTGSTPNASLSSASRLLQPSPMTAVPTTSNHHPTINTTAKPNAATPAGSSDYHNGFGNKPSMSPTSTGFLEAQNSMLLERLLVAENRAKAAESQVEQLKDQIQTMNFGGDMMQSGAGDMEREARLFAEDQLSSAHAQLAVLQETVRNMQTTAMEKQSQLEAAETAAQQLTSQLSTKTQELQAAQSAASTAMTQVSQLLAQQATDQQALVSVRSELTALQAAARAEVSGLNQRLEEANREIGRLQTSVKRSADENIALQLKNKQQDAEAAKQNAAFQSSLVRYKTDRDLLRKQLGDTQTNLSALQEKYNQDVAKLKHERDQLIHMADELMGSLEHERAKARAAGIH